MRLISFQAYYAIVIEGRIRTGSSVLIHSGYTILGEASIAVALSLNCNVFTSADSLEEAKYIITRFSNVRYFILNYLYFKVNGSKLCMHKVFPLLCFSLVV